MSANTYYGDYLQLAPLLSCQNPRSAASDSPAHDELLFIITHQAYELWFKQVLHELRSVLEILQKPDVPDHEMDLAVARLERIIEIQHLLIQQIQVLETMRPLDFLEFRNLLIPASGFQSFQFRMLENYLGLPRAQRLQYHQRHYYESLSPEHQELILESEKGPTLFDSVQTWLERIPFLEGDHFDFWQAYREAVETLFRNDREHIAQNPLLSEKEIAFRERQLQNTETEFATLFDPEHYQQLLDEGKRRLSYRATKAALLIMLYQEKPMLQMPLRLLNALTSIDELLTTWRYRHALMVQRMIGLKQGTGGSMGYQYLHQTLDAHRIFGDFTQLTTFLIPRSARPDLPEDLERKLGFSYREASHVS